MFININRFKIKYGEKIHQNAWNGQ